MKLPYDLHVDLITVAQAAELAGVSDAVIRQWKRRGHLSQAGATLDGRPLFRGIDVLRAQAQLERKRRRRQAPRGHGEEPHVDRERVTRHAPASG